MNDTLSVLNLRRPTPHPELSYWSVCRVEALFERPFLDLVFEAASVHRQHFDAQRIQLSTLLSVKTGGCPEDCAYCPQSARYDTGVKAQKLLDVETVLASARVAKSRGASRFCMGAAWRGPKPRDIEKLQELIRAVKDLGLETCFLQIFGHAFFQQAEGAAGLQSQVLHGADQLLKLLDLTWLGTAPGGPHAEAAGPA